MGRKSKGHVTYPNDWTEVDTKFRQASTAFLPQHAKWLETYEFIRGNQNINPVGSDLTVTQRDRKGEAFVVDNKMRSAVRTAITTILPQPYRPQSRPFNDTVETAGVARAQDFIVTAALDAIRFHETVHQPCAKDFLSTGRAIAKVTWVDDYNDAALKGPREGSTSSMVSRPSQLGGFPHVYAVSPFRWLPAPYSKPNYIPWCIEITAMHRNEMVDRWGAKSIDGAELADSVSLSTIGLPSFADAPLATNEYASELYIVLEYWELPTKNYPDGRYLVTTKSQVLEKDKGVYELPYVWVTELDDDDGFSGTGMMSDAVPLQKTYNNTISQIVKVTNQASNQPLIISKDSGYEDDIRGGGIIRLGPGDKPPEYMAAPKFPSEAFKLVDLLKGELQDVTGVHDASLGDAPKNLRSGAGVSAITSNDAAKLVPSANSMGDLFVGTCKRILSVFKANVPGEIAYSVLGPDNAFDIKQLYTHEITSFQIVVEPIPGFMMSKAEFVQGAIQAFQLGLHFDQGAVLNALGLVDMSPKSDRTMTLARQENAMMLTGQVAFPQEWEDHYLHAEVVLEALMGEEFQIMKEQNPEMAEYVRQLLVQHRAAHLSMMHGMLTQQQQRQMAGGGQQTGAPQGQDAGQQAGGRLNPSLQGSHPNAHTPDSGGQHTADVDTRLGPGGSRAYT